MSITYPMRPSTGTWTCANTDPSPTPGSEWRRTVRVLDVRPRTYPRNYRVPPHVISHAAMSHHFYRMALPEWLDALKSRTEPSSTRARNDRVRVLNTVIPVGDTVPVHTHQWPACTTRLTPANSSAAMRKAASCSTAATPHPPIRQLHREPSGRIPSKTARPLFVSFSFE